MHKPSSRSTNYSEVLTIHANLGYLHCNEISPDFSVAKEVKFPSISVRSAMRMSAAQKEDLFKADDSTLDDCLDDMISMSKAKQPVLKLGDMRLDEFIAGLKKRSVVPEVQQTPQKRTLEDVEMKTPLDTTAKRHRRMVRLTLDGQNTPDINEGCVQPEQILRMIDDTLIDTPEKMIVDPKVLGSAPGPSPRVAGPKYMYDDHGLEIEIEHTFREFNPWRRGNMPPPTWRSLVPH